MQTISLKMEGALLHEIDSILKSHRYSTRTEFIRNAIRDKLEELSRDELVKAFINLKGKSKKIHTDKEWEIVKEKAYKELLKERGWD